MINFTRNNVQFCAFVIIPNHFHAIIRLFRMGEFNSPIRGTSNTVGAIVRGYKLSVTKQLNLLKIESTVWQRNYYEHIIRDDLSYQTITAYIKNNPKKWQDDKFYSHESKSR